MQRDPQQVPAARLRVHFPLELQVAPEVKHHAEQPGAHEHGHHCLKRAKGDAAGPDRHRDAAGEPAPECRHRQPLECGFDVFEQEQFEDQPHGAKKHQSKEEAPD